MIFRKGHYCGDHGQLCFGGGCKMLNEQRPPLSVQLFLLGAVFCFIGILLISSDAVEKKSANQVEQQKQNLIVEMRIVSKLKGVQPGDMVIAVNQVQEIGIGVTLNDIMSGELFGCGTHILYRNSISYRTIIEIVGNDGFLKVIPSELFHHIFQKEVCDFT